MFERGGRGLVMMEELLAGAVGAAVVVTPCAR